MIAPELKFERKPIPESKTLKETWQDEARAEIVSELTVNESRKVLGNMFRIYCAYSVAQGLCLALGEEEKIEHPNYEVGRTCKYLLDAYKSMYGGETKDIFRELIKTYFGDDVLKYIGNEGEWLGK